MKFSHTLVSLAAAGLLASMAAGVTAAQHGHKMPMELSRYGGPVYSGSPMLNITASLVQAGGGPEHFSTATALTAMVGGELVNKEVAKLTKQYGKERITSWLRVGDFAVDDALKIATKADVKLPHGTLSGKELASALVQAGIDKHGTFYVEYMLDKLLSHKIHMTVMDDIDAKYGTTADREYHRISNQALYDLAQALGDKKVKLAHFH